jgi:CMP-N-acetylneuraminic acid synthetase
MISIDNFEVLLMARAGSKRFKNKNLAEFSVAPGKPPLLEWKIEQLLQVFDPSKIILSTDSSAYSEIGKKYSVRLHYRSNELTENGTFSDNLVNVALFAESEYLLYSNGPCNPLIGPKMINNFISSLEIGNLDDGVFAVEELKGHLIFENNWLNFEPGKNHLGSEFLENPLRVVWGLTCRSRRGIINNGSMFSTCNPNFEVPSWAAIDVDFDYDLKLAESFYSSYLNYEG